MPMLSITIFRSESLFKSDPIACASTLTNRTVQLSGMKWYAEQIADVISSQPRENECNRAVTPIESLALGYEISLKDAKRAAFSPP